ncbi:MSP domain and PapD-like domain-containing protein [Strongyloides ratti]|uniref:Major sperm protein n=1 Tax=Strongyloides ratti TaxID=34506 RepID=A0A090L7Y6_STRRB|nr:MSP domain and PapD-like domain-containing protein [Strongyloides ratti]CEF64198.1 MSP domain and PapD-like domain-containing protein [Strongyloides ratti]
MSSPIFFYFNANSDRETKELILRNTSKKDIVYKVRQSCPLSVKVKPYTGAIKSGKIQVISVTLSEKFSKIQSAISKIYLDIFCLDVNKDNYDVRRSWLYGNNESMEQLSHRLMLQKVHNECPRRMVIDLPDRASLVEPIILPIDFYSEGDTKTCHPIDEGIEDAEKFDWKDKLFYHPKRGVVCNDENVMESHIRVPSNRVVSNVVNDIEPKVIDRNNASNGIIQSLVKFLFPPIENNTIKENVNNDVTGPIDLKADVTTYKATERKRKRGTLGICGA